MKKSNLLLIGAAVAVSLATYAAFQCSANPSPTNMPILSSDVATPKSAAWKEYSDSSLRFSVELPPSFSLYELERSAQVTYFTFGDVEMFDTAGYDGQWFIEVRAGTANASDTPWKQYHTEVISFIDDIDIDGISAKMRHSRSVSVPDWDAIEIAFTAHGNSYVIRNDARITEQFYRFLDSFSVFH